MIDAHIDVAAALAGQGLKYKIIEKILKDKGIINQNGKPYHNATISSNVVNKYPSLRRSAKKGKERNTKTIKKTKTNQANKEKKLKENAKKFNDIKRLNNIIEDDTIFRSAIKDLLANK